MREGTCSAWTTHLIFIRKFWYVKVALRTGYAEHLATLICSSLLEAASTPGPARAPPNADTRLTALKGPFTRSVTTEIHDRAWRHVRPKEDGGRLSCLKPVSSACWCGLYWRCFGCGASEKPLGKGIRSLAGSSALQETTTEALGTTTRLD